MWGSDIFNSPVEPGKCLANDFQQIYPVEFTIIRRRSITPSRSPQCRAFSRAVMDEKSLSPLFPVGERAVNTNVWCINR